MKSLAIFSAPKPFTDPRIALIQRNAIRSWTLLPDVEVLLVGEEEGLHEAAQELGARHLIGVARTPGGTPLVSSIFALARAASEAPLLAYVNADILLRPDFVEVARAVAARARTFLLVGRRWDLDVTAPLDFSPGWPERLLEEARARGTLHPPAGSDYFIFPRACFQDLPHFAIGRAGWDNWMIYHSRRMGWRTIDATGAIEIVHQNHDYSHLPGGRPHYRHPESEENARLAGGRMVTRFALADANWRLEQGRLRRKPLTRQRLLREIEIFPLLRLNSPRLAGWTSRLVARLQPKEQKPA